MGTKIEILKNGVPIWMKEDDSMIEGLGSNTKMMHEKEVI